MCFYVYMLLCVWLCDLCMCVRPTSLYIVFCFYADMYNRGFKVVFRFNNYL